MKILNAYKQEFLYLWPYILPVIILVPFSYSIYFIFDPETVSMLGKEDHLFEWLTVIFFIMASVLCLKMKNIYFYLFFIVFLFSAGEEISWGQRIFGFDTPDKIASINVQNEFNLHNLDIFSTVDSDLNEKKGLILLITPNYLFRVLTILFGIVLPFLVFHVRFFGKLIQKFKIPVPPISIGIFFFLNWIIYRTMHTSIISNQYGTQYLNTADEIFECGGALILFLIFLYFYNKKEKVQIFGQDLKKSLIVKPSEVKMITPVRVQSISNK